ncbi:glycine cleavage system protein R [Oryzihumus sp.]|uniref:glycine cleavage system protein R n=1 Tax=Oryzihumus sp. TaxID=1968903 RepID=UPI002EDAF718
MSVPGQVIAVTVLGQDRPGIVADVTGALADLHGNLEDSTMTLLRGHFAMVLLVRTGAGVDAVESALRHLTADGSLVINARVLADPAPSGPSGPSYALHVHGADRPGIVATITRVVAEHGGNIVDLGTRLGGELYVLMAELQLPDVAAAEALERDLRIVAGEIGVDVHLTPVEDELL